MDVKLVVVKGKTSIREVPLAAIRTSIGRKNDCLLRIPSPMVSRQHCELTVEGDSVRVRDLGSSNGTFVNGSRVEEKELKPGDTLGIGPITFVIQIAGVAAAPGPIAGVAGKPAEEDTADFVLADEVGAGDAPADFVVTESPGSAGGGDFVVSADEATGEEADFVLAEDAGGAHAGIVLAEDPTSDDETVHDMTMAEIADGKSRPAAAPATPAGEAPAEAAPTEPPKKKKGLFGWLSKKKKAAPPAAEPAAPAAPDKPAAAAAPKTAPPAKPAAAKTSKPPAAALMTADADEPKPTTPVGEEELADFLMGLNEKDE